jgi:hypothetical protein
MAIVGAAAAAAFAPGAPADAATVQVTGRELVITGDAAAPESLTVDGNAAQVTVGSTAVPLVPLAGCRATPTGAVCAGNLARIRVLLGAGNDSFAAAASLGVPVRLDAGAGDDTIALEGSGRDAVSGGAGDDRIDTRDGRPADDVTCGPGTDVARIDPRDRLLDQCEDTDAPQLTVGVLTGRERRADRLRVSAAGALRVGVRSNEDVAAVVRVWSSDSRGRPAAILGTTRVSVRGERPARAVTIRLTRRGVRTVLRRPDRRVLVVGTARDRAGNRSRFDLRVGLDTSRLRQ